MTCAEGLGSDSNDIALLEYTETILLGVSLAKTFLINMATKAYCRDLAFDSVNIYFTFYVN